MGFWDESRAREKWRERGKPSESRRRSAAGGKPARTARAHAPGARVDAGSRSRDRDPLRARGDRQRGRSRAGTSEERGGMTKPRELAALVEGYLDELALTPELGELAEPIRYALAGGGKRIRPVLCLATGEALGREPEELLPAGAAVELVHNFPLVHDDLPAL